MLASTPKCYIHASSHSHIRMKGGRERLRHFVVFESVHSLSMEKQVVVATIRPEPFGFDSRQADTLDRVPVELLVY